MYFSKISFFPGLFDKRTVTLHGNFLQLHTLLQVFTSNLSDSLNEYTLTTVTEIQFLLLLQATFLQQISEEKFLSKERT
jgi:hypothetical protein